MISLVLKFAFSKKDAFARASDSVEAASGALDAREVESLRARVFEIVDGALRDASGTVNDEFCRSVLARAVSECGTSEKFYAFVHRLLRAKRVFFVRHAHTVMNQWNENPFNKAFRKYPNVIALYDVKLSDKGVQQCKDLRATLNAPDLGVQFDKVFLSPLGRVLNTFQLGVQGTNAVARVAEKPVITSLIREKAKSLSAQIGQHRDVLRAQFGDVYDFAYLHVGRWWRTVRDPKDDDNPKFDVLEDFKVENRPQYQSRASLFYVWLAVHDPSKYTNLLFLSHAIVTETLSNYAPNQTAPNAKLIELEPIKIVGLIYRDLESGKK